jgi:glycosyltransferase involved in cell wall biosynthesis
LRPIEAYKTTYPNKVFDYMAAGKPVLLAIDGAIRQVVEEAGCGVFVPPGDPIALADAIRFLAADPERAHRMGIKGKAYLQTKFDRQQIAERLLAVIVSMTGKEMR